MSSPTQAAVTSVSTPLIIPNYHHCASENNHLSRSNGNGNATGINSYSNYGIKVSNTTATSSSSLLRKTSF